MKQKIVWVVFDSEYDALHFSTVCKEKQVAGRLAPVPRQFSAGCGMAWRSEITWRESLEQLLANDKKLLGELIYEK